MFLKIPIWFYVQTEPHKIQVWFIQQYYHNQHIYAIKNSAYTYISVNNMNVLHNFNSSLITITKNDLYISGTALW